MTENCDFLVDDMTCICDNNKCDFKGSHWSNCETFIREVISYKEPIKFYCKKCGNDKDFEYDCEHEDSILCCSECHSEDLKHDSELMEYGMTSTISCRDCGNWERYSL